MSSIFVDGAQAQNISKDKTKPLAAKEKQTLRRKERESTKGGGLS